MLKTAIKILMQTKNTCYPSHVSAAETSVQQASKQVQVDLQDLGYETCGRSENEAEREDTSSPGEKKNLSTTMTTTMKNNVHCS